MAVAKLPIALAAVLLVMLQGAAPAAAVKEEALPAGVEESISKGLSYLAKKQNADGSFDSDDRQVPVTGLVLLAFLASGHTPDVGRYGLVVRSAEEFLLARPAPDGYIGTGARAMYTHAIVTLALAEACGVESSSDRRARIFAVVSKAVEVILAAQRSPKSNPSFEGGWRYEPKSTDSDLSLSGWNVLGLRAAQQIGVPVPDDAFHKAAEFVLRCFDAKAKAFAYQPGQPAQAGDSAIAIVCLDLLNTADAAAAQLNGAQAFLAQHPIDDNLQFPYYNGYYIVQATLDRGGESWTKAGRSVLLLLLKQQDAKDGGWLQSKTGQEPGRLYATAMATATLAAPFRLLPVYQR